MATCFINIDRDPAAPPARSERLGDRQSSRPFRPRRGRGAWSAPRLCFARL